MRPRSSTIASIHPSIPSVPGTSRWQLGRNNNEPAIVCQHERRGIANRQPHNPPRPRREDLTDHDSGKPETPPAPRWSPNNHSSPSPSRPLENARWESMRNRTHRAPPRLANPSLNPNRMPVTIASPEAEASCVEDKWLGHPPC